MFFSVWGLSPPFFFLFLCTIFCDCDFAFLRAFFYYIDKKISEDKSNLNASSLTHWQHRPVVSLLSSLFLSLLSLVSLTPVQTNSAETISNFDSGSLSVNTPVQGGLSIKSAILLMRRLRRRGKVVCVDVVEFNPTVGDPVVTVRKIGSIVRALMR